MKIIAKNRKAFFKYSIDEKIEAGIELIGPEVKSIREGKLSLSDSYAMIKDHEVFLIGMHISPYAPASFLNQNPKRQRKLLLRKNQIFILQSKLDKKGYTLVPLSVYFKGNMVKVELGLAKGKKIYDKRESIKKREMERAMRR